MSMMLKKCLVDTNVPMNANLAAKPDPTVDVPDACVFECIRQIQNITQNGGLVVDDAGEIFMEYISNLSLSSQPGVGDTFAKWVQDNQWNPDKVNRVVITKKGETYDEFPEHDDLNTFDNSDRKFVAVANAHPEKPPIFQATDSKWWGWKDALAEVGITVHFLCPDYTKVKYAEKTGA
ncbi:MAG: hypothetical protein WCO26_21315 [Deltaproteobacteria bacterium]